MIHLLQSSSIPAPSGRLSSRLRANAVYSPTPNTGSRSDEFAPSPGQREGRRLGAALGNGSYICLTSRLASATVYQNIAARPARAPSSTRETGASTAGRNEKAVKSLETNNSAKCPDFAAQ